MAAVQVSILALLHQRPVTAPVAAAVVAFLPHVAAPIAYCCAVSVVVIPGQWFSEDARGPSAGAGTTIATPESIAAAANSNFLIATPVWLRIAAWQHHALHRSGVADGARIMPIK